MVGFTQAGEIQEKAGLETDNQIGQIDPRLVLCGVHGWLGLLRQIAVKPVGFLIFPSFSGLAAEIGGLVLELTFPSAFSWHCTEFQARS